MSDETSTSHFYPYPLDPDGPACAWNPLTGFENDPHEFRAVTLFEPVAGQRDRRWVEFVCVRCLLAVNEWGEIVRDLAAEAKANRYMLRGMVPRVDVDDLPFE